MRVLRGIVLGAGIAYLFDPQSGRGRRAKLIGRRGRVRREGPRLAGRKTRFAAGQLHGLVAPLHQDDAPRATDDGTVLQRIRTEALRAGGAAPPRRAPTTASA